MIFPTQRPMKVLDPTIEVPNLPEGGYLPNALSELHQTIHFLKAYGQGYVQLTSIFFLREHQQRHRLVQTSPCCDFPVLPYQSFGLSAVP